MEKYTYKESGIEWLGEIPEHWETKRLFNICDFIRGNSGFEKNDLLSEGKYVALQYGKTYKVEEVNEEFQYYINEKFYKSSQIVNYGDVIFVSTSETMEDLGHSVFYNRNDIGLIGGEQILLKPNKNILDGKYLFYASKVFGNGLNKFATGIKVFRFDVYDLKTIYISLPKQKEQKVIAEYLDKTTARIDRIIAIKQEQLVKMEASLGKKINEIIKRGVKDFELKKSRKDFIGEIPKHYKVQKLKHITTKITDGAHFTPNYLDAPDEKSIPFLRVTDVQVETIDLNRTKFIDIGEHNELIKRCNPEKGDLLLSKNGTIGVTKVVDWDWDFSIFVSLCLIKPDRQLNVDYLNYFFKSEIMDFQIKNGSKQITVTNLHLDKIRDFYIVTPPINEQEQIVKRLKDIELKFNDSLKNIKTQIITLQAYRKSLIHECVTGKKQVTSAIINKAYA